MTWSKDKLRALAHERGETAVGVGQLLLAHERMRGRTEEDYPRDKAAKELDALLERQVAPLPHRMAREYAGLEQLRTYAADKALSRAVVQSGAKEKADQVKPETVNVERAYQQRETERERG